MNQSTTGLLALAVVLASCGSPPKAGDHQGHSAAATSTANTDATQTVMQEHMKKMHAQMEKIHQTTDPAERQKLMSDHMQAMHQGMGMMCGMGSGCMGGGGKMGDGMKHGGGMMQGGMMKHHEMIEKRMDMMQNMMQQMLEHQVQKDKAAVEAQRK